MARPPILYLKNTMCDNWYFTVVSLCDILIKVDGEVGILSASFIFGAWLY